MTNLYVPLEAVLGALLDSQAPDGIEVELVMVASHDGAELARLPVTRGAVDE